MEWQSLAVGGFGVLYLFAGIAVVIWEAKRPKRQPTMSNNPSVKMSVSKSEGSAIIAKAGV